MTVTKKKKLSFKRNINSNNGDKQDPPPNLQEQELTTKQIEVVLKNIQKISHEDSNNRAKQSLKEKQKINEHGGKELVEIENHKKLVKELENQLGLSFLEIYKFNNNNSFLEVQNKNKFNMTEAIESVKSIFKAKSSREISADKKKRTSKKKC